MAINHCGLVLHQSLVYLTQLISIAECPIGFVNYEIMAEMLTFIMTNRRNNDKSLDYLNIILQRKIEGLAESS